MGEILPDGSIQGYSRICENCGETISVNMQGDSLNHKCRTRLMTDQELLRAKEFLDYFKIDYSGDIIYLSSGDTSMIMNKNTQWKEFLGYSISSVAEAVARKLNKKIEWREE